MAKLLKRLRGLLDGQLWVILGKIKADAGISGWRVVLWDHGVLLAARQ